MNPKRSDDAVLAASLAATWLLASSGGRAKVDELAAAAGVSRRTFHRMFPRKEDCIRPAMADAQRVMFDSLAAAPRTLAEAFPESFRAAAEGAFAERTRLLLPVVADDPQLQAVWDHEVFGGVDALAPILVQRQDAASLPEAEVLAAALLAVTNLALRDAARGADPGSALERRLDALLAHLGR